MLCPPRQTDCSTHKYHVLTKHNNSNITDYIKPWQSQRCTDCKPGRALYFYFLEENACMCKTPMPICYGVHGGFKNKFKTSHESFSLNITSLKIIMLWFHSQNCRNFCPANLLLHAKLTATMLWCLGRLPILKIHLKNDLQNLTWTFVKISMLWFYSQNCKN